MFEAILNRQVVAKKCPWVELCPNDKKPPKFAKKEI